MYLKSIEIHGFKSFANKIVFDFPQGITGIVGPNGSGKSNVADAVRWVLGEQKIKQLRGAKMEDVIFAGTSARKPQGYAFVAITFNNSDHRLKIDFDEVTISRRVYRSGESEYMINGSVCRLRDVQELFYDTGIGKEGYSIIGQGQIDKILQGKPEERREIFDEAAGIVKFKKRKTIAVRKLESERQNLSRINDILSELKRQVGPLQKQSEAAQQFVVYKNELKKYDINLFLYENGDIKAKIKDHQQKEEIARNDLERSKSEFESVKAEYEKLENQISLLEERISQTRNQISRGNIIKESLNGQINVLTEQIRSAQDAENTFRDRVKSLTEQISEASSRKEMLVAQKNQNQEKLTETVKRSGQIDSAVLDLKNENENRRIEIEELKQKLISCVNERGELNARIERLNATMEEMQRRKDELKESIRRFNEEKSDSRKELEKLQGQYDGAVEDEKAAGDLLERKRSELRTIQQDIQKLDQQLSSDREKAIKQQASLESLRNITERYEGYGNTIKEIMKLKDRTPGIRGVVADIIRTQKEYETAIETALGGSIQNIVTEDEATAKSVIEYLKKNRLGRATFLPMKAIAGREFKNTQALEEKGVIGLASSLVQVDDIYKGIASYLLGGIIVADTVENALFIARKYHYSLMIVTLEGELLNRGGSLTGGAFKNKSNLLGRRREMDELEASVKALRSSVSKTESELDKARQNLKRTSGDIELYNAQLQEKRLYLNTLKINLQSMKNQNIALENRAQDVNQESENLDKRALNIADENMSISEQLSDNEKLTSQIKDSIVEKEKELEVLKQSEASETLSAQTLKVELSKLTSQDQYLNEQIIRETEQISRFEAEISALKANNESSSSQIEEKQKEIEKIKLSLEEADSKVSEDEKQLDELERQKALSASSHRDFIQKREDYTNQITNLDKELFRLTSTREKLEERFETKSNYIWEEYQLTYNNALDLRDEELNDARQMRDKIANLKTSIRGLGTINVSAIEEYKEVKERYDFLQNQHDDLTKAEADLVKIIRDLDREMRKQFNTEFKKIRTEYTKVFKELFGGGSADIELEEDVDVLEAGITVTAQPPGKKLQNMMQLSGGEKALTAIALLFAIQNLKPSPFCILDEIEAALDDSNIIRFAGYLEKLSENVQFIVITHRKGTMEAADRLYGITMQERGVSTLISVNLADVEDEQAS